MSEPKPELYICTGPGGMNCPCCGPAPGKARRLAYRSAKRKAEIEAFRIEQINSEEH